MDAYLKPCINLYLSKFYDGFDEHIFNIPIHFMQSDGGLVPVTSFSGFKSILSGPAAGYVGYAHTTPEKPVIGFIYLIKI